MTFNADALISQIEADTDRAMSFNALGDRVLMVLAGSSDPWFSNDNQVQSVSLVVPNDNDFYAKSLNIYLESRKVIDSPTKIASTESDLAFRPAMWVTTDNGTDIYGYYEVQDANASWKMTDTFNGTYQGETGLRISTAYSARYGQGAVSSEVPLSAWPGKRSFFIPRKLVKGSTVSFAVTPTFGRKNATDTNTKTQFRASIVLMGYKIVRRSA